MRAPTPLPRPFESGPFRVAEALEHGVGAKRLRGRDLERPFHGVRSGPVASPREHAGAYAAWMPPHHAFGGTTAARLWGLPLPNGWVPTEPLVIARPSGTTRGRGRGTRHIAVDASRLRLVTLDGLRLLDPLGTALTLARELDHEPLVHVVDALLTPSHRYPDLLLPVRPWTTPEETVAFVERCRGLRGAVAFAAALADARVGVDSRFESVTRRILALAGLPEPTIHPEVVIDGIALHPDLGYPRLRVAVEYEGEGHLDPRRAAEDILRYEMLERAGWIVVRVTRLDLARGGVRLVSRVAAALVRRGA